MALPVNNDAITSLINSQQLSQTKVEYPSTNNKLPYWILEQRRRFKYIPNITEIEKFLWMRQDLPTTI